MHRPYILIVYGTRYGQTAKIADRVADMLGNAGCDVDIRSAPEIPPGFPLAGANGVIVAASVIVGRHQRAVERFVRDHLDELNRVPSAFLSVSGAAASRQSDGPANARLQLEHFLTRTGWRPRETRCVAGAVSYTAYGPLTRWLIRTIQAREGGPTDTSRDHEFTDWEDLRRFAEEFASLVSPAVEPLVGAANPLADAGR